MGCNAFILRGTGVYGTSVRQQTALVGPDVGRADHLGPLLGFISDELPQVCGRIRKCRPAQVRKPRSIYDEVAL
jgi:hypothetical protein